MAQKNVSEDINSKTSQTSTPTKTRAFWIDQLNSQKKDFKSWESECKRIVDKYKAKGTVRSLRDLILASDARFNILWSNAQVLMPALYARTPKPDVERRHKDNDKIARLGAEVIERSLDYEINEYDFDGPIGAAVLDYLLCGRGQCRIVYEPQIVGEDSDDGTEGAEVVAECAKVKYVFWRDFKHGTGRIWDEVRWVAFRTYETRDSLKKRFTAPSKFAKGKTIGEAIPLDYSPRKDSEATEDEPSDSMKRAQIWEIWDKDTETVFWISESYPDLLDVKKDPLGLKGFFPCPKPLFATVSTDILVPVPDYILYQTHAITLDVIQQRLGAILDAMRANGCYNAAMGTDLSNILKLGDGKMYPIQDWKQLTEKGGLQGIMDFVPIESFVQVFGVLNQAFDSEVQKIYEITGISDIARGSSDPNETAKAQQIKGQFGTLRLSTRQSLVQDFARDIISMMGEIICEHFSPDTIRQMSGYDMMPDANPEPPEPDPNNPMAPPPQDEWTQIVNLLKNDPLRRYSIQIETDSTVAVDTQANKEAWTEYLKAVGGFVFQAAQILETAPALGPYIKESLLATSRAYKCGTSLEDSLSSSFDAHIQQISQPPPPPPPDPRIEAEQIKAQVASEKHAIEVQKIAKTFDIKKYQIDQKVSTEIEQLKQTIMQMQTEFKTALLQIQKDLEIENQRAQTKLLETKMTHVTALTQAAVDSHHRAKELQQKAHEATAKASESAAKEKPTPAPAPKPPVIHIHNSPPRKMKFNRNPKTGLTESIEAEGGSEPGDSAKEEKGE